MAQDEEAVRRQPLDRVPCVRLRPVLHLDAVDIDGVADRPPPLEMLAVLGLTMKQPQMWFQFLAFRYARTWRGVRASSSLTLGCQEYSLTENSKVDSPIMPGGGSAGRGVTEGAAERGLAGPREAVGPHRVGLTLETRTGDRRRGLTT